MDILGQNSGVFWMH